MHQLSNQINPDTRPAVY